MKKSQKVVYGSIESKRISGLLFDVDGTLSDTDDRLVERLSRFLLPVSWLFKNRDSKRFARRLLMAMETPGNFLYGLADSLGIDKYLAKIYHRLPQKKHPQKSGQDLFWIIPGVKEMLDTLADHYPMAVVSARDAESTLHFLEHFGLLSYFDAVVTSQTCPHTKPYPDPVIYAAKQLGLTPDTCLMIGDTIVDVHAGKEAGAQTAAVLCGFGTQRELQRAGADIILSSTPDVMAELTDNFTTESEPL